ncbi:Tir-cytoskeleton coupling protein TccP2, partial [Escherichia coli]|nr:Tir-cytoskeleton coupling protein TccP2 [Escherichia coli]
SSIPRSISSVMRNSSFTASQHKSTPNTVKTSSPLSPSNSPASATTIFKVKNSYTESGLQRSTSYTQSSIEKNALHRPLPDVAKRLVQHLAEHGIQPARNMAEHIPPAPNWPAPPPPVQNEQSRPLPDVAQRLMQHLAEHGIQPARNMAEHIPPAPNWPAPPPPVQNEQSRPLPDVAQRLMQHLA